VSKRKKEGKGEPTLFDRARNELFSQIRHCGVLKATEEQQDVWFKETMDYLAKRYPGVTAEQLAELDALGRRYCQPVIGYGRASTASSESR
jgi:hypothetical protein